jgi:tRNA (mo5U34)-methyltransferase
MTPSELQAKVDAVHWHHGMDFGGGVVAHGTKSAEYLTAEAERFFGSIELSGRSFLDIGAWDGFYSLEAKRRGSARVLATDKFVWSQRPNGRAGFDLARQHFGLDIEVKEIGVEELSAETVGLFDVVLFAGVFYHLMDAPRLLQQVAALASKLIIVETYEDLMEEARPAMVYYPGATLSKDPTNFWGPNPPLVRTLLTEAGFELVYHRPSVTDRGTYLAFRNSQAASDLRFDPIDKGWTDLSQMRVKPRPPSRTLRNLARFLTKKPMR